MRFSSKTRVTIPTLAGFQVLARRNAKCIYFCCYLQSLSSAPTLPSHQPRSLSLLICHYSISDGRKSQPRRQLSRQKLGASCLQGPSQLPCPLCQSPSGPFSSLHLLRLSIPAPTVNISGLLGRGHLQAGTPFTLLPLPINRAVFSRPGSSPSCTPTWASQPTPPCLPGACMGSSPDPLLCSQPPLPLPLSPCTLAGSSPPVRAPRCLVLKAFFPPTHGS